MTLSSTANGTYLGESAWSLNYEGSNGWSGSGGGYSHVYAEPLYQYGVQRSGLRTVPDVTYDADPNLGVWVYDSLAGGWQEVGGTSAGAPQWAALIAEVNQGRALVGLNPLDGASQTLPGIYAFSSAFHDVTTGYNGYWAGPGYDLATGLGKPVAYVLGGDLAFHIPCNYLAVNALDASPSTTLPAGRPSSFGMGPLMAMTDPSGEAGPVARSTAVTDGAETSRRDSLLALPSTGPTNPSRRSAIGTITSTWYWDRSWTRTSSP
jgi:hypothetical protein